MKIVAQLGLDEYKRFEDFLEKESPYKFHWHSEREDQIRYKFSVEELKVASFEKKGQPTLEVKIEVSEFEDSPLSAEKLHELVDLLYSPSK